MGNIELNDDVAKHLPKLVEQKILIGYEGEKPVLIDRKNAITLRYVLS